MSSPEITAESLVRVAREHGYTMVPGNGVTLDRHCKLCCAIGGAALLLDPRMARTGYSVAARALVMDTLGESGAAGLENGFEGWQRDPKAFGDPMVFLRYRAIGKAVAKAVELED